MKMAKKHLIVAGNIGAGKSTLVGLLADSLACKPYYEPVTENPYLEDFYSDMGRWALLSQIFFLAHRAENHQQLKDDPHPVVQDRSVYEDAEIFAKNLRQQGHLSDRDWNTYLKVYATLVRLLPPPDIAIYIRASVPTLKRRIAKRGRAFEEKIPDSYLEGLNKLYEEWIDSFSLCPVVTIPGDELDFVENPSALNGYLERIKEILQGGQPSLF